MHDKTSNSQTVAQRIINASIAVSMLAVPTGQLHSQDTQTITPDTITIYGDDANDTPSKPTTNSQNTNQDQNSDRRTQGQQQQDHQQRQQQQQEERQRLVRHKQLYPVVVGNRTFHVTGYGRERILDYISDLRTMQYGRFISLAVSFLALFNLVPKSFRKAPERLIENAANVQSTATSADEIVQQLLALSTFERAMFGQLASRFRNEQYRAISRRDREAARFWTHLYDILHHPERYDDGGIRIDESTFYLRPMRSTNYESVVEFTPTHAEYFTYHQILNQFVEDDTALRSQLAYVSPFPTDLFNYWSYYFNGNPEAAIPTISLAQVLYANSGMEALTCDRRIALLGHLSSLNDDTRFRPEFIAFMERVIRDEYTPLPSAAHFEEFTLALSDPATPSEGLRPEVSALHRRPIQQACNFDGGAA